MVRFLFRVARYKLVQAVLTDDASPIDLPESTRREINAMLEEWSSGRHAPRWMNRMETISLPGATGANRSACKARAHADPAGARTGAGHTNEPVHTTRGRARISRGRPALKRLPKPPLRSTCADSQRRLCDFFRWPWHGRGLGPHVEVTRKCACRPNCTLPGRHCT